jgi:hypothetical protein
VTLAPFPSVGFQFDRQQPGDAVRDARLGLGPLGFDLAVAPDLCDRRGGFVPGVLRHFAADPVPDPLFPGDVRFDP